MWLSEGIQASQWFRRKNIARVVLTERKSRSDCSLEANMTVEGAREEVLVERGIKTDRKYNGNILRLCSRNGNNWKS